MEGVNHVDIVQVGSGSLVCNVYWVLQGQIPYGESLELGISCTHATLVLVVQLAKAYSHLAAARARSRNNNQGATGFNIVILAKSLVRRYEVHVVRIALNKIMAIGVDAVALQPLAKSNGGGLPVVVGYDNRTNHKATVLKLATQTQHVLVVGYAKVGTLLVLLDVGGTDNDNNLDAVANFLKHAQFAVGHKARKHTAGMMVVEKLAPKFEVQFSVKL